MVPVWVMFWAKWLAGWLAASSVEVSYVGPKEGWYQSGPEIRQIDTSSVEVSYVGPSWLAGGGSDECVVVMGWVGVWLAGWLAASSVEVSYVGPKEGWYQSGPEIRQIDTSSVEVSYVGPKERWYQSGHYS